jgi:hypothetical protein
MKVYLSGGMDAQGSKTIGIDNSDFKIANNSFGIIKELSLRFWGRRNSPLFYLCGRKCILYTTVYSDKCHPILL